MLARKKEAGAWARLASTVSRPGSVQVSVVGRAVVVVFVDGGQHVERKAEDEARTRELEAAGYIVVWFWNGEVFANLDGVLKTIRSVIEPDQFTRPLDAVGKA